MTLYDPGPSGKMCFVYCGDDRCDCAAGPRYRTDPAPMTTAPHQAAGDALREAVACCLARLDGWTDPYAPFTDNMGIIAAGGEGDPVWLDYVENADALISGPLAPVLAARATAEAERDAAIKVCEMTATSGGFYARQAENATKRAEAAESRVVSLTAALDRLKAENADLRTQVEAVPHADRVKAFYGRILDRHSSGPRAALRHQSEPRSEPALTQEADARGAQDA